MKGPISIKSYKTIRCYYFMSFSEARRTSARKKRFSGSLDYRMSKRQTYSFMRDAHRGPLIKAIYSSPDKTERL